MLDRRKKNFPPKPRARLSATSWRGAGGALECIVRTSGG